MLKRSQRAALGRETVRIVERGFYEAPSGATVSIADQMMEARRGTRLFQPDEFPDDLSVPIRHDSTAIEVTSETTLQAAARLAATFPQIVPCCLNFASAKNPGGGFLGGSQAQEESLARSSGLYACLNEAPDYYRDHRNLGTSLYSDRIIHSPRVPVFRDDQGTLLEIPFLASFLTSPAVNAGAVHANEPTHVSDIEPTMRRRLQRVLWVAHSTGEQILVLGAWGCGVFRNDPAVVARLFAEQLLGDGPFHRRFAHVTFAVFDPTPDRPVLEAFRHAFEQSIGANP